VKIIKLLLIFGLIFGAYVQEVGSHVERLPVAVQPYARPVHAVVEPRLRVAQSQLVSVMRKLGFNAKTVGAVARSDGAGKAEPLRDENDVRVIAYSDGDDLLRQLKYMPTGQKVILRSMEPKERPIPADAPPCWDKARCEAYMKKKNAECDELNRGLDTEFARVHVVEH